MKYIPLETAKRWIALLTNCHSLPTAEHIDSIAPLLEWKKTDLPGTYTYLTPSGPTLIRAPCNKDNLMSRVSFKLAANPSNSLEGNIKVADFYIEYIEKGDSFWGPACDFKTNITSTIWKLAHTIFIEIYMHSNRIGFSLETIDPNNQQ